MMVNDVRKLYARLDANFVLFCRRPNIRQFTRFISTIRFLLEAGFLSRAEYKFLVDSARAVYESCK